MPGFHRVAQLVLLTAALPVLGARAATIQSNGTGGGDWNTPSTWTGGMIPLPADDVVILDGDAVSINSATVARTGYLLNRGALNLPSTVQFDSTIAQNPGGILRNEGTMTLNSGALINVDIGSEIVNAGLIQNGGYINSNGGANIDNKHGATINFTPTGRLWFQDGTFQNDGDINNSGLVQLYLLSVFTNAQGRFVNDGTLQTYGIVLNGFCGRITNNSNLWNNDSGGIVSNCGLIDGTVGLTGLDGTIDTSCGGGTPDATVMVQVTDATTSEAVPAAEVYLERVCLPMGTRVPFMDVDAGAARYFVGAVEPAQYEIKAFAPGYAPVSGRVVILQSGEDHIEDLALTPDPTAVNTMKIDIDVDTGGSLVTNNFRVIQDAGTPFQPVVTIDGLSMKLVGLNAGDTTAQALIEDYSVTPVNTIFLAVQPRVYAAVTAAVTVGDSGTAVGKLVFAVAPPSAGGIQMNFKKRTEGLAPPLSGHEFTGADHVFGAAYLVPVGGHPDWFAYAVELNAGEYYIAASNSQNTIMSQVVTVTIEPSIMGSYSEVPDLNISLPSDDTDGDALPDAWENEKGLNASSASSPNGGLHDKESDGLGNLEEFTLDIHPNVVDTDGDTYADGFERFAGSNPKIADSPPLLAEVYVRYNITEIIRIGSQIMPMASVQTGIGRLANGGTIYIQNAGATPLAEPGALTLGTGNKPMVLRLADPAGPPVRLGSAN